MKGLPIVEYTKEYRRKRSPNIRSLGGVYFFERYNPDDRVVHNFQEWHDWNCGRCKFDFLTNEKESLERLGKNQFVHCCRLQSDIVINQFEHHRVPETTLAAMGMSRYGIGTCAEFEELEDGS